MFSSLNMTGSGIINKRDNVRYLHTLSCALCYSEHVMISTLTVHLNTCECTIHCCAVRQLNIHDQGNKLTVNSNYDVRNTEHKNNENSPDSNLCNPATMVPCISTVILVFYTNHHDGKYCKKQEVAQAYTKNSIHLKPFVWWCLLKCIYPWNRVIPDLLYGHEINVTMVHLIYHKLKFNQSEVQNKEKYCLKYIIAH